MSVIKRKKQFGFRLFTVFFCMILAGYSYAQEGRSLPILEVNPDARSSAMGNISLMSTDRNYLYVNPSSILYSQNRYTVSANSIFYPKQEGTSGQLWYGNVSGGWRFANRHAVFVGYRYLGGLSIPQVKDQFGTEGKSLTPFDWSIDAGYSFKFNDQFSAFASASFIQSWVTRAAYAGSFSIGGNYMRQIEGGYMPYLLNVAAKISDFGSPLYYSAKDGYSLPTSAQVSADMNMPVADKHEFHWAVDSRYFFLPSNAKLFTAGVGAEYTFQNLVSARLGYRYANNGYSKITFGAGVNYGGFNFDIAYLRGTSDLGSNNFMLSLNFNY